MGDALIRYGLFLAETVTIVLALVATVAAVTAILARRARAGREHPAVEVKNLNHRYDDLARAVRDQLLPAPLARAARKQDRKQARADHRAARRAARHTPPSTIGSAPALPAAGTAEPGPPPATGTPGPSTPPGTAAGTGRPRVFVLDFHGDLRASQVTALREEITAVLLTATERDEVVLRLENPGGTVHEQGLAASQLRRLTERGIPLTVAVDKIAASGGYMMACVAGRIVAAPFAVVGSIGVIDQTPNFHRLLDRHGIDYEMFKGGEHKRTVTLFGRTTDEDRARRTEEVQEVHELFKDFVAANRPGLDLARVATGQYWYGSRALELGLVDELTTSDDYLLARRESADIYQLRFTPARSLRQRLASRTSALADQLGRLAASLGPRP